MSDTRAKLQELALYVAKLSESDPDFGRTKLQKHLFTADFMAYGTNGKSISGARYEKQQFGPVVSGWPSVKQQMEEDGVAAEQQRGRGGYIQHRLVALRDPDLSMLSGEEVAIVQDAVKMHDGRCAVEVSEWSHGFIGWDVARPGEEIPYETMFVVPRDLTDAERKRGCEIAETCGV